MRKKVLMILTATMIFSLFLFAGCGEKQGAENTPSTQPTNTEAPTAVPTNTPEPTATEVSEPTATTAPEPTATLTPTPEPTATPTPEPTATPTPLTDGKQLHTAEEFVNLVTRVKEERAKNPEADGGNSGSYEAETDVKTDDGITEKKSLFDNKLALYGVISAGCAVIIVIIIVAVICIKKRKKTYEHK